MFCTNYPYAFGSITFTMSDGTESIAEGYQMHGQQVKLPEQHIINGFRALRRQTLSLSPF
jgi:hypothetical protein